MGTFRTPTDNIVKMPFLGSLVANSALSQENRLARRLMRHVTPGARGRNVFLLTDNTYTESQPGDMSTVRTVYHGGHDIVLTAAEETSLIAAGYGSYIT